MVKILSEDKSVNTLWDILQYLTHHSSTICQRAQASFFFYLFSSFFNITSFLFQFSHYSYYLINTPRVDKYDTCIVDGLHDITEVQWAGKGYALVAGK